MCQQNIPYVFSRLQILRSRYRGCVVNIILCGLPMSGKSYLGEIIARHLKWPFIDTDRLIEQHFERREGRSLTCRDICLSEGEGTFRLLEKQAVASLMDHKESVIATGGGTFLSESNLDILKKIGKLIYLKTDNETLLKRLLLKPVLPSYLDPQRPLESFKELAMRRLPAFEKHCHLTVDTNNLLLEQILDLICDLTQRKSHG